MTLLIVFLALTNMAVGYGLAVYFAGCHPPIQIHLGRFRKPKPEVAVAPESRPDLAIAPSEEVETISSQESSTAAVEGATDTRQEADQVPEVLEAAAVEAGVPAEESKPIPDQVPQLDVSDLMADAQAAPKVADSEPAVEESPEAVDEPSAVEQPDEEEETLTQASEESVEATEEAEAVDEPKEADLPEEPAAADADSEVEAAPAEAVDELESLAQLLQTAVAASGDDASDDATDEVEETESPALESLPAEELTGDAEDAVESSAETDVQAEDTVDPVEGEKVTEQDQGAADTVSGQPSHEVLSGLEAFQLQLKNQAEQALDTAQPEEPTEPVDVESPSATASEDDAVLAGIEAFQSQLQQQSEPPVEPAVDKPLSPPVDANGQNADGVETEAATLEAIEAFQAKLQEQASLAPAAQDPESADEAEPPDSAELCPQILAGIESFRSQLAEMRVAPAPLPKDEAEDTVDASGTT